jgi:signal transduction histidine kinase
VCVDCPQIPEIIIFPDIIQNLAGLDFSETYEITTKDEIGDLGESINFLSGQLENAILELQTKNRQLEEDIEKERKIDKMRKEFVSNVSHELKTPLSLIQGYAEGLKLNVMDDEKNKQFYCEVIIDEAAKMDKLVKDLLHLSQIDSGYYKLEKTNFDLSSMIEYVVGKFKVIFADKDIAAVLDIPDNLIVNGDIIRVEQVLVNYISNALQHVDENKFIKLDVQIHLDKVRVSVFNTGKNIPEDETELIWTSFYKIDKARTRDYGGCGLGLSIVRAIQEQHHNAYGIINKENGVEFWFELDYDNQS